MPPINLWSLPDKSWFDHPQLFKPHSRETANKPRVKRANIVDKIKLLIIIK